MFPRRTFLADLGLGFTGLALGAMLHRDRLATAQSPTDHDWRPPDGNPHFKPKAKSVIWLFMNGGVSHMESFDPKPMLTKYAGKTIAETPFAEAQAWSEWNRSKRLVSGDCIASRQVSDCPFDVDDRQQPRRADTVPFRSTSKRR